MSSHRSPRTPPLDPDLLRAPKPARSSREVSPQRKDARRLVAGFVRAAAGSVSLRSQAQALGLDPSFLEDLADAGSGRTIALADVVGGRRDFARLVLTAALAAVEERAPRARVAPERHLLAINRELGELAAELERDLPGGFDEAERARLRREAEDVIARTRAFIDDLEP